VDIAPLGNALERAATHAILKTPSVELIRVVLRAGAAMPHHRVSGDVTLQCLEGAVDVTVSDDGGDGTCRLQANQMVLVPGGRSHGVSARQDASLLMTIVVPPGAKGSASSTTSWTA
jgi:quercetin dioxygenase-like cupin family protein